MRQGISSYQSALLRWLRNRRATQNVAGQLLVASVTLELHISMPSAAWTSTERAVVTAERATVPLPRLKDQSNRVQEPCALRLIVTHAILPRLAVYFLTESNWRMFFFHMPNCQNYVNCELISQLTYFQMI